MLILATHVFYLLGKYVYKCYCLYAGKTRVSTSNASEIADSECLLGTIDQIRVDSDVPIEEEPLIFRPPAYIQRYCAVADVLHDPKYREHLTKVVEFGCAELSFLTYLKKIQTIKEIILVDLNRQVLEDNKEKAIPMYYENYKYSLPLIVEIYEGSAMQNDNKLLNTDAVICIELIEHLYPNTLVEFASNIFGFIIPKVVVITTPNADFNVVFPNLIGYRHPDHKFEWTRQQFQEWAHDIVSKYSYYSVTFQGICNGPIGTEKFGACTQMAIFHRHDKDNKGLKPTSVIKGIDGLYKKVASYRYSCNQSEDVFLSQIIHCIYELLDEGESEVDLNHIRYKLKELAPSLTRLRTILKNAGWVVENREWGEVVLVSHPSYEDNSNVDDNVCKRRFLNWRNYVTIGVEEDMKEGLKYEIENLSEESSIIIPQNRSIIEEHSRLFDGENLSTIESIINCSIPEKLDAISNSDISRHSSINNIKELVELTTSRCASEELAVTCNDNIKHSNMNSTKVSKQDFLSSLTSLTSNETEINGAVQTIDSNTSSTFKLKLPSTLSTSDTILCCNLESKDKTKEEKSVNIAKQLILHSIRDENLEFRENVYEKVINFEPHLLVSSSLMSPERYDELDDEHHILMNSTFRSEAVMSIEDLATANMAESKESSSLDNISENKINSTKDISLIYSETNDICNIEQNSINSIRNHIYKNNDMTDIETLNISSNIFNNKPKLTSSPKHYMKLSTTDISKQEDLKLTPRMNSNTKLNTIEAIENILDIDSNSLEDISEKFSNSIVTKVLKYDMNYSISNNAQQELCLENKEISSNNSILFEKLMQDTNEELTERINTINCETDIVSDVQKIDAQDFLSPNEEDVKYKVEDAYCTSSTIQTGIDDVNLKELKAHLEYVVDYFLQPNVKKKNISLSEKLNFESQYDKNSFECAKEDNVLRDGSFLSCKNNEDTYSVTVQFASILENDESLGILHDTKNPISKDVNISNIAGFVDVESPLDSLSHEIMDSGYPNSASAQDITPENDLSSIVQDHISDIESPSIAEAPRLAVLEPIEVENGDLANNNRDDEGNNMIAADVNDIEGLQPFIDVLENDLENENDIYVLENDFPMWLLRILDMANPLDFDVQPDRQNMQVPVVNADDANYMGHDEGFDSSSDSDI